MEDQTSTTDRIFPPSLDLTDPTQAKWNPGEETLYRTLANSLPGSYCSIAQSMLTKTCRQVYDFARLENRSQDADVVMAGTPEEEGYGKRPASKKNSSKNKKRSKQNQHNLYKGHSRGGVRENKHQYTPCYHPGASCSESPDCSCAQTNNFCEKFCYCPPDCKDRFPGCKTLIFVSIRAVRGPDKFNLGGRLDACFHTHTRTCETKIQ